MRAERQREAQRRERERGGRGGKSRQTMSRTERIKIESSKEIERKCHQLCECATCGPKETVYEQRVA